jgi:prepilin-type N-terminal cleavage/methylation domain-containing protein/prepilin-type processing-associated H-X9-DG protein
MRRELRRAFTLIELLVVVTILVVLLALLTPSLDKAMSSAEQAFCGSAQRSLGLANQQYALMSRQWFVPVKTPSHVSETDGTPTNTWAYGVTEPWWFNLLYIELVGGRSAGRFKRTSYNAPVDYGLLIGKEITCPSAPPDKVSTGALWTTLGFNTTGYYYYTEIAISKRQIDRLERSPASVLQMIDTDNWFNSKPFADYRKYWDTEGELGATTPIVPYRHHEGANGAFFDGHVAWSSKTEHVTYNPAGVPAFHTMWDLFPRGQSPLEQGGFTHDWIPNPFTLPWEVIDQLQ